MSRGLGDVYKRQTKIDADLVDEIISNIGYYASEKDLEGIKEEVHRYVLYRTQK